MLYLFTKNRIIDKLNENDLSSIKELIATEGKVEHFLGNGRSIIIENVTILILIEYSLQ